MFNVDTQLTNLVVSRDLVNYDCLLSSNMMELILFLQILFTNIGRDKVIFLGNKLNLDKTFNMEGSHEIYY